jgi:hypothetical protein
LSGCGQTGAATGQSGAPASAGTAQPAPPPDATAPTAQPPPTIAGGGGGGELCHLHGTLLSPDGPDPQQVLRLWQQIYAAAPAEIKPDVHTILEAVTSVVTGEIPADQIDQRLADPTLLAAFQRMPSTWRPTAATPPGYRHDEPGDEHANHDPRRLRLDAGRRAGRLRSGRWRGRTTGTYASGVPTGSGSASRR